MGDAGDPNRLARLRHPDSRSPSVRTAHQRGGVPMTDGSPSGAFNIQVPDISLRFPPLPAWLAKRLLRPGERICWVYGPWFSPSWERYVTHPVLFFFALAFGACWVLTGWLIAAIAPEAPILTAFAAVAIVLGSI